MSTIKLPGMVDAHVHLRDPGATHKEDFTTGTQAAIAGGVTMVLDMPNNPDPIVSLAKLKEKAKIAAKKSMCDYSFIFGASQIVHTKEFKKSIPHVKALKLFLNLTTGTLLLEKLEILKEIFEKWESDKPIMVHAEDSTLLKAIALSHLYKRHLHVCHVNQKEEVEIIRKAKERGYKITAETGPHYLYLAYADLPQKLKKFANMKPPLYDKEDIEALWKGIKDGTIDMIATDHAPHTKEEKLGEVPFFGVPGLETALALLLQGVRDRRISMERLIDLYNIQPRKIFGLPKQPQTYLEVDLEKKWKVRNENLRTKCGWSLFDGWNMQGMVEKVVIRGKTVYENGQFLVKPGFGKAVN